MSDEYEKTNVPGIVVDKATNNLALNTDMGAYHAIKKAREDKRRQAELVDRVTALELEVANLKHRIEQDNRD